MSFPLHTACQEEDIQQNPALVNQANQYGIHPIHIAVEQSRIEIVKLLLPHVTDLNVADQWGDTVLHYVSRNCFKMEDHIETLRLLLRQKGIDVNKRNNGGWSPISVAISRNWDLPPLFAQHPDIDLSKVDKYDNTALHTAVAECNWRMVRFFLDEYPALKNLKDKSEQIDEFGMPVDPENERLIIWKMFN